MSRLLGGVASIVILAACGTLVHATPYYGAISVNFSTAVTNPSDAYYAQPSNWNNLDPGFGATTNLLDNAGATVAGISIQRTAGGETDVASIVGNTGQSLSSGQPGNVTYVSGQVGFNGMVNAADPFDGGGPTSFTITGIPYSSYDVAIMTGWYENGVGWHLIDGAISGPQNFTDNWVQNTVSGQISGSTFTFTGNPSGTSVYGVQVLNAVPEPSLWAPAAAIALIGLRLRRRRA